MDELDELTLGVVRRLARRVSELDARVRDQARASQGRDRSVEGGSQVIYDDDGEPRGVIGEQDDGSYGFHAVAGPPPPVPSTPLVATLPGGATITWDGFNEDDEAGWPADFIGVKVYMATVPGDPPDDETYIQTMWSRDGGAVTVAQPADVTTYVVFTGLTDSGAESEPSVEVAVTGGAEAVSAEQAAALEADVAANAAAVAARPRVVFATEQPVPVGDERVLWYDTDNGYAASYWDGAAWGPYQYGTGAIAPASVVGTLLADLAVTAAHVAASAITTTAIAADAVTAGELASSAVTEAELADLAATGAKLAAGSVTSAKIVTGTITAAELAAGSVQASEIAAGAVVAGKIGALAVTTTELAADAVTAAKIAAGTITAAEIATDTITAVKIAANAITASELAADSVVSGHIAANTIVAADVGVNVLTATEIAANAINASELNAGQVSASHMVANTLTAGTIAADAIGASELAALAVSAGHIASNTITATQIATNAITADELAAGAVTATHITATAIDGKTITGSIIQTATSGKRIVVDGPNDVIRFYTGISGETSGSVDSVVIGPRPGIHMVSPIVSAYPYAASVKAFAGTSAADAYVEIASRLTVDKIDVDVLINGVDVQGGLNVGAGGGITGGGGLGSSLNPFGGGVYLSSGTTVNTTNPPSGTAIPNTRWVSGTGSGGNLLWTSHANSSIRYKEKLRDLALEVSPADVLAIPAHSYDWREDAPGWHEGMGRQAGFIAEDLEAAGLHQWLGYDEDGLPNEVDYAKWTILLHLVAQAHDRRLDAANRTTAEQGRRLHALERQLENPTGKAH